MRMMADAIYRYSESKRQAFTKFTKVCKVHSLHSPSVDEEKSQLKCVWSIHCFFLVCE